MVASVAIEDLFPVLLPRCCPNGWLGMLTAYFDDSGTHTGGKWGPSRVVVVAGICGTEWQLRTLEAQWAKHLDRPLCGRKNRLSRFHMVDCHDSQGEFTGWSRTETDYFCQQLQDEIINSGVGVYGIACSRADWDDIVTGELRDVLGDAEGYCISQCYVRALAWANATTFDPQITFVFDNRTPEIERRGKAIESAFQVERVKPQIVGTAFLSSLAVRPLQAADLVAWEVYQHAREILSPEQVHLPKRPALRRLGGSGNWMHLQIARRRSVQQIADMIRGQGDDFVTAAAKLFREFDPSKAS